VGVRVTRSRSGAMMAAPMDATQSALRAGDWLDRYELLCPIASGGMATVWLARLRGKRGFEKLFAIKTIRTELVDDPLFQEMLLDEARIASNIQHPNVAQILDLGEAHDVLFIVMERVDGDSLTKIRKLLARLGGSVPLGIALRILADACAGLHAAHELRDEHGRPLGIVHRDVSPQNILVSVAGAVKVIDFGIAKAQNRQQGETRTGVFKGKVQYMAPEQVKKGATVDRRADIWALGICLHELVAGKVPNDGDDHIEMIRKVLSDEPPQIAEGLPVPVMRILERSLKLDPEERFPTAAAMQDAFEEAMDELGVGTTGSDIAAFLRSELPELEEKRRGLVSQSVDDARGRDQTPVSNSSEEAFAPTVMRERAGVAHRTRPRAAGEATLLDDEPIRIPKQSRAWLWSLLILIAAGVGLRLSRPSFMTQALGAATPAWVSQWLAKQGLSLQASAAGAPNAAQGSPSSLAAPSGEPAEVLVETTHRLATPRPGGTHIGVHGSATPVVAASAEVGNVQDASAPVLARPLARSALGIVPSATAATATATSAPPVDSVATPPTTPIETEPTSASADAGESSPYN
jgi:serine/threonine protein kinase